MLTLNYPVRGHLAKTESGGKKAYISGKFDFFIDGSFICCPTVQCFIILSVVTETSPSTTTNDASSRQL